MKIMICAILVASMLAVTGIAIGQEEQVEKGPLGKVVSTTVDATKKVSSTATSTVGVISENTAKAADDVTSATGDVIEKVADTTDQAAEDLVK